MRKDRNKPIIWNTPEVSADALKNFACLMMLIRTVGITVVERGMLHTNAYTQEQFSQLLASDSHMMTLAGISSIMQLLGGLSVPLFAFLLVEGFLHTSCYRRYLLSVFVFAILSEIPYDLANYGRIWDIRGQNALFSMLIGLLMLYFLRMLRQKPGITGALSRLLIVFCAVVWAAFLRTECGLCTLLLIALFYLLYASGLWKTILGILVSLLYVPGPLAFYGIWCYNEVRKNRIPKYAYYLFYPLHLLLLGAAVQLTGV